MFSVLFGGASAVTGPHLPGTGENLKKESIMTVVNLIFQLFPLFKEKLSGAFREDTGLQVKCSRNQNMALFYVKEGQAITLTELGRFLDLRKGSLTALIDSLEKHGLVRRSADPADRRKALLSLTEEGEKYIGELKRVHETAMCRIFSHLPEEEIDELTRSLRNMVQIMRKL